MFANKVMRCLDNRLHLYSVRTNSSPTSRTFLMCKALPPTTFSLGIQPIHIYGKCMPFLNCVDDLLNTWRFPSVGRMDDVIVLSSGYKAAPSNTEAVIASCPYISGAVMFGRERSQVGILVEPSMGNFIDVNDDEQVARFRNQVW